ncbi:MAG: Pyridoxamine 5'-phosphate oxidase [Acidobacteria bacterium OLB17]|nr:MAG: Pyridoxamine 5'-phosphate oxidase [Acidobacteria bacterium OLB17]MCZ2391404.1 pyridoxamine 5'-phosphate oxidase family protein [Acidobacteriota bacterium]
MNESTNTGPSTPRVRVKRLPDRGKYDRETIEAILDEGFICHVGFNTEHGPAVIPTAYGRDGGDLIIHGSAASRMLRDLAGGIDVCVTVTLVDGVVLARSAFHHSINYRSVVIYGRASVIAEKAEKAKALEILTEHIIRGRWKDVRPPTDKELKGTTVLRVPLAEASAKVRVGPPKDDEEDYSLPIWAGVLPLRTVTGAPIADERNLPEAAIPEYLQT